MFHDCKPCDHNARSIQEQNAAQVTIVGNVLVILGGKSSRDGNRNSGEKESPSISRKNRSEKERSFLSPFISNENKIIFINWNWSTFTDYAMNS
jgi:hypothetical protein